MKNVQLIFNAVLAVAVILLFVLVLGSRQETQPQTDAFRANDTIVDIHLPLAFVNIDSLLLNYQFARESSEKLMRMEEDARASVNTRIRQLETAANDFQRRLDAGAFLSRERAEREHENLMRQQQNLQQYEARRAQELFAEQQRINEQLRDTITSFLAEFNERRNFEIIFSNTGNDNILHAKKKYDVTREVIDELNARFAGR